MKSLSCQSCVAAMALFALAIASPAAGQSKATCAAYRDAAEKRAAEPVFAKINLLTWVQIAISKHGYSMVPETVRGPANLRRYHEERLVAILRALSEEVRTIQRSPAARRAYENEGRAQRKAYRGPVVKDPRAMAGIVWKDVMRCRLSASYWPADDLARYWPRLWKAYWWGGPATSLVGGPECVRIYRRIVCKGNKSSVRK